MQHSLAAIPAFVFLRYRPCCDYQLHTHNKWQRWKHTAPSRFLCKRNCLEVCVESGKQTFWPEPNMIYTPPKILGFRSKTIFFSCMFSWKVVLLWECQCNVSTMMPRCGKMVLYRGNKTQRNTLPFLSSSFCHWQSLGFDSGLLHPSENCCTSVLASHSFRNTEVGRRYQ